MKIKVIFRERLNQKRFVETSKEFMKKVLLDEKKKKKRGNE